MSLILAPKFFSTSFSTSHRNCGQKKAALAAEKRARSRNDGVAVHDDDDDTSQPRWDIERARRVQIPQGRTPFRLAGQKQFAFSAFKCGAELGAPYESVEDGE